MNVLIVGGSGGIGRAMVKEMTERYPTANIIATYYSRQPDYIHPNLKWKQLDVTDNAAIERLARDMLELDWLLNCTGLLHTTRKGPEKCLGDIQPDFALLNFSVNTLSSVLLARAFTSALKQSPSAKFAVISAKVGSISDNRLGGWYSYRMSKAALNMFIKTLSIEWRRTVKAGTVLALHPGTTDTSLSKPFQHNVPKDKLFTPTHVATMLTNQIEIASPQESGRFIAYDGTELDW